MSERPTVRPVTLARLVELTNTCEDESRDTEAIETALAVSHRRARETILEATRIGLVTESETDDERPTYSISHVGAEFLDAVRAETWQQVSEILATHSPHYGAFLEIVAEIEPAKPPSVLEQLEVEHEHSAYDFNQTSIEVVGDWGERLGAIQRNAFTGSYYRIERETVPPNFAFVVLSVFDELEETAGINLTQRYLSIPKIREYTCERLRCTRDAFDKALLSLARQNVGKIELSGAPMDTGAKDAELGIKQIELATGDGLVSTDHSTEQVMAGVEQFDKQYYYLAIHDDNLTYTQEPDT